MSFKDQKSAKDAYSELMSQDSKGCLVDVRSNREWCMSGVVDLSLHNSRMVLCEWRSYPSMNINENFFDELLKKMDISKIDNLYFMCAAGVRSQEALEYTRLKLEERELKINCINISDGFEGNTNTIFNLGKTSGWKGSGLAWCEYDDSMNAMEVKG